MTIIEDLSGTSESSFGIGVGGARVRSNAGTIEARNATNTALAPLKSAAFSSRLADTGSGTIDLVPTTTNCGLEIKANGGIPFLDLSRTLASDYDVRLQVNSSTEAQLVGAAGFKFSFGLPIELQNTVSIKPSGGNGVVLSAGTQTADRTFTFPTVGGNREIVASNPATTLVNGALLIGNTGAAGPFVVALPTGLDGTIVVTPGPGSLDFAVGGMLAEIVTEHAAATNGQAIVKSGSGLAYATISGSASPNTLSFSNAARTILAAECTGTKLILRQTGTISAARVVTLPAANAVAAGYQIDIVDESGTPAWWYPINITPAGSDTIGGLGSASPFQLNKPWQTIGLVSDGASKWSIVRNTLGRRDLWIIEDDFVYGSSGNGSGTQLGFAHTLAGTGSAAFSSALDSSSIGVIRLATGSTATGRAAVGTRDGSISFGSAVWRCYGRIKVSVIPDATEDYELDLGFSDVVGSEGANGCYFLLDRDTNASNLLVVNANQGNRTRSDSGVSWSSLATDWLTFGIEVNAAASQSRFFINGTETTNSPLSTNMPTTARTFGITASIRKAVGAANRNLHIDWLSYSYQLTTPR